MLGILPEQLTSNASVPCGQIRLKYTASFVTATAPAKKKGGSGSSSTTLTTSTV